MKEHGIEAPEVKSFDLNNEKVWFKNTYRQVKVQLVNGFVKRMRYFRHTLGNYLLLSGILYWYYICKYIWSYYMDHMYILHNRKQFRAHVHDSRFWATLKA